MSSGVLLTKIHFWTEDGNDSFLNRENRGNRGCQSMNPTLHLFKRGKYDICYFLSISPTLVQTYPGHNPFQQSEMNAPGTQVENKSLLEPCRPAQMCRAWRFLKLCVHCSNAPKLTLLSGQQDTTLDNNIISVGTLANPMLGKGLSASPFPSIFL